MNPAWAHWQADRVYRRDIEDVALKEEEYEKPYESEGPYKKIQCVSRVKVDQLNGVWRREDDDTPLELDEVFAENMNQWLSENANGEPILDYEEPVEDAYETGKEKHQMSRIETGILKPGNGIVARAQQPGTAAIYVDSSFDSLLPTPLPRIYYPRSYSINRGYLVDGHTVAPLPFVKPRPIIDPLPNFKPLPTDPNDGEMHIYNDRRGIHNKGKEVNGPFHVTPTDHTLIPPMAADALDEQTGQPLIMTGPNQVVDNNIPVSVPHPPAYGVYRRDVEGPVATQQPSAAMTEALESSGIDQLPHGDQDSIDRQTQADGASPMPRLSETFAQEYKPEGHYRHDDSDTFSAAGTEGLEASDAYALETDKLLAQYIAAHKHDEHSVVQIHRPATDIFRRQQLEEPAPSEDVDLEMVDKTLYSEPSITSSELGPSQTTEQTIAMVENKYTHKPAPTLWRRNEDEQPHNLPGSQDSTGGVETYFPSVKNSVKHTRIDKLWRRETYVSNGNDDALSQAWRHHMGHGPFVTSEPSADIAWSAIELGPGPVIPDVVESYLPLKRSPVPPPELFEDSLRLSRSVRPAEEASATPATVNVEWNKYETPPIIESTVRHRSMLPEKRATDPETVTLPSSAPVNMSTRADASTSANAPKRTNNIRHTVLPVVSRVYLRATAFKYRLKASSSKTATTFSTVAVPVPTQLAVTPSPTKTPSIINLSKDQQHTGGDVQIDPSKAEVHGSRNRVFDNKINSRSAGTDGVMAMSEAVIKKSLDQGIEQLWGVLSESTPNINTHRQASPKDDGIRHTTPFYASKVHHRTPLLRLSPLPSKAATTLSKVTRPNSTQPPSPTRTPIVDIHTIPHESTKPPPVIGTGATTHPSVTRVYDNPPLHERRSPLTSPTPPISPLSTV
jgi:hypothetical protein